VSAPCLAVLSDFVCAEMDTLVVSYVAPFTDSDIDSCADFNCWCYGYGVPQFFDVLYQSNPYLLIGI
jgi:hypothetical protein